MKLVSFLYKGDRHVGALVEGGVVTGPGLPCDMIDFLAMGDEATQILQMLLTSKATAISLSDLTLLAPIARPGKFLGIGLNYADHIGETGRERPEHPMFFTKQSTCVIGPNQAIHCPAVSEKVDYEGELGVVVGKRCKHVSIEKAPEVIAGYTICNDVTVRDWQHRSPTWTLGKSFDTHGPMGPWLVTSDEIADPHNLNLKTWVDDELRQDANTRDMLFNCFEIVAYLSQAMTLEPGDVISTGTPAGVGVKMKPRGYLKPGQTVRVEIEGIGALTNPVIAEPEDFVVG